MTHVAYVLPDVAEGLQEAEILTWQVAPGDTVQEDQTLVEIETDKSVVEISSPYSGTVVRLGGAEGDVLAVGALLVEFEVPSGDVPADGDHGTGAAQKRATPGTHAERGENDRSDEESGQTPTSPPAAARRVLASPSTRRLAVDLGVSLDTLEGTGQDGRVTREDVEAASGSPFPGDSVAEATLSGAGDAPRTPPRSASVSAGRTERLRGVRRRIAQNMTETLTIPAINEWRDVDATELVAAHRRLRERLAAEGVRLTLLPVVLKATAAALQAHPRFNARIDMEREEVTYHDRIDIGVATATPEGLQVPVVRDANQRSLRDLATEIDRLAAAVRERTLAPTEAANGTCTVSNFGSFGAIRGLPLIRPPEVAIVGIGRIHDAVVAVDGTPAVRPMLPLVVATDHRLNDGDHLAAFIDTLVGYLADPTLLLVA